MSPPDLGWTGVAKDSKQAWLVCIAAVSSQVVHLGILHAFGVFFVALLEDFPCTKAAAGELQQHQQAFFFLLFFFFFFFFFSSSLLLLSSKHFSA